MKDKAKLKGKDLINIGIYAAIYCVIMTAVAMLLNESSSKVMSLASFATEVPLPIDNPTSA